MTDTTTDRLLSDDETGRWVDTVLRGPAPEPQRVRVTVETVFPDGSVGTATCYTVQPTVLAAETFIGAQHVDSLMSSGRHLITGHGVRLLLVGDLVPDDDGVTHTTAALRTEYGVVHPEGEKRVKSRAAAIEKAARLRLLGPKWRAKTRAVQRLVTDWAPLTPEEERADG